MNINKLRVPTLGLTNS